jgi:SPP1 gp7 family putative phage head morphogenesis protein
MIVNYFEPALNFTLAPDEAINYFSGKGLKPTYSYMDMLKGEHDRSFTVAKMMDTDLLDTVHKSMQSAIANGESLQEFKKKLTPVLQNNGWWGKKSVINADLSISTVQLGSSSRLDTIYRTNMQSAYAAGKWDAIQEQKVNMPFLMYDAVDDSVTRLDHAKLDTIVFRVDDPFWQAAYPPNGYNCRCGVIQMDDEMLEAYGLSEGKLSDIIMNGNIPAGVDFGFDHNAGIGYMDFLGDIQKTKLSKMDTQKAAAAQKGIDATKVKADKIKATKLALDAEKLAAQEIVKAKAIENAQQQLKEIGEGKAAKQASIKKQLYEKAKKAGISDPIKTLENIVKEAAEIQAVKQLSSTLTGYKKKVLAGKLPTNTQQKVFDGLTDVEKTKVIAAIEKQKAAQAPPISPNDPNYELSIANMKQIGDQAGSNPGGLYYDDQTGLKWYIKLPPTDDHARNEQLAAKLYEAAGVEVPNVQLITDSDGRLRVASQIIDDLENAPDRLAAGEIKNVNEGFVVDAWLANWDVVGLDYDNMLVKNNRAVRIDTGGALLYRAQGAAKGDDFDIMVNEIETLRDPSINPQSARVFANVTDQELSESVKKLEKIDKNAIAAIVNRYAPGDAVDRANFIKLIEQRRGFLVNKLKVDQVDPVELLKATKKAESDLKSIVNDIDNKLVDTLKGINKFFASEGIRSKDKERFAEFRSALNELLSSGQLDEAVQRSLSGHYDVYIREIVDAINIGTPLSGSLYKGYTGPIKPSKSAIDKLIIAPGDLPPTSPEQAQKILEKYVGTYGRDLTVPQNGKQEYQQAYNKLSLGHKRAISAYTGSYYSRLNNMLYKQEATPNAIAFRDLLNEALKYSDNFEGLSARGIGLSGVDLTKWIEGHKRAAQTGEPIRYLSFISSTMGEVPAFKENVTILIHGKTGTWVNPISLNSQGRENEVLLPANATFNVMDVKNTGGNRYTIVVQEVDAPDVVPDLEFNENV